MSDREYKSGYETFLSLHQLYEKFNSAYGSLEKEEKNLEIEFITVSRENIKVYPDDMEYYMEEDHDVGYSGLSDEYEASAEEHTIVAFDCDISDISSYEEEGYLTESGFIRLGEDEILLSVDEEFDLPDSDLNSFTEIGFSTGLFMYEPEDTYKLGIKSRVVGSAVWYQESPFLKTRGLSELAMRVLVKKGDTSWRDINTVPFKLLGNFSKITVSDYVPYGTKLCRIHMKGNKMVLTSYVELEEKGNLEAFGDRYSGEEYTVNNEWALNDIMQDVMVYLESFPKPVKEVYWFVTGGYSKLRAKLCSDGECIMVVS